MSVPSTARTAAGADPAEQQLTDPGNDHHLPESGDDPSTIEVEQLREHDLSAYEFRILRAFRAGWDQGVIDRADRARREQTPARGQVRGYAAARPDVDLSREGVMRTEVYDDLDHLRAELTREALDVPGEIVIVELREVDPR